MPSIALPLLDSQVKHRSLVLTTRQYSGFDHLVDQHMHHFVFLRPAEVTHNIVLSAFTAIRDVVANAVDREAQVTWPVYERSS